MPKFLPNGRCRKGFGHSLIESLESRALLSAAFFVSAAGKDANSGVTAAHPWRHIQKAFNSATPGSIVTVEAGRYNEKLTLNVSGSAAGGSITFQAQGHVIIDGAGLRGANLVDLSNHNYIKLIGFDITNDLNVTDGAGIRIEGTGSNIVLQNNAIHHITGKNGFGIAVYGQSPTMPISNLAILGNTLYDCQPAPSETLSLDGNVTNFQVIRNVIHDVNNIGIDFIGGEGVCPNPRYDMARNGTCIDNYVARANSNYGGGYAAGIYVDGGQNITLAYNSVTQSDLGIEVGCENAGRIASGIVVRDNFVYQNDKAGIVFGGYDSTVGRVVNCQFLNNTLYHNDTLNTGNGELWIQYASGCTVENNLIASTAQDIFIQGNVGGANNTVDYNLYYTPDGPDAAIFLRNGIEYDGFSTEVSRTPWDHHSIFADPKFVNAARLDFHLSSASLAINAGNPSFMPAARETDIFGHTRVLGGRVDIGAVEAR